jgi:hypothetical protein
MTVAFTRAPGIRFWDSGETIASPTSLVTVSVLVSACAALALVLETLLLDGLWRDRTAWRWYTYGRALPEGSASRRNILRELESDVKGFDSTRVSIDSHSIPSLTAQLQRPLCADQFAALAIRRQNLLAIVPSDSADSAEVLAAKGHGVGVISEAMIGALVHEHPDWVLAMYFDDGCDHCVLQLFGSAELLGKLRASLLELGAEEASTRDSAVLSAWMR